MAGKLVQVATETVSSAVASVTLTGIDSDDVYMLAVNNLSTVSDAQLWARFTVGGTADTTSNYDEAQKYLISNGSFSNVSDTNDSKFSITATVQNTVSGNASAICYLYNLNNSSEYSFATVESTFYAHTNNARGYAGGAVHTVAQSCDGIFLYMNTGNITSGTFTLFRWYR